MVHDASAAGFALNLLERLDVLVAVATAPFPETANVPRRFSTSRQQPWLQIRRGHVNSERFSFVWSCGNEIRCNCFDRNGPSGKIRVCKMSGLGHPSDVQRSTLGQNHCCAIRKRVIGYLCI